jgi:hypothetical protein
MAVPMTVKMPDPMTAPMPSAVSDQGPRLFFSARPGSSDTPMSLSIDLRAKNWLGSESPPQKQPLAASFYPLFGWSTAQAEENRD